MKNRIPIFLLLVVLIFNACSPVVSPPAESPTSVTTEESIQVPTPTNPAPQPEQSASNAWKIVRDTRFGFGLAVPCWWLVSPIPEQGFGGVMGITNYDEAYFMANSNKGFWDWPNGALKLDIAVMEGVEPSNSDTDAYMQFVDPTMTGLVASEQQQIGGHTVTVVTLANLINTSDPHTKVFIYRLSPDKLLMIAFIPQSIIDTPDFQAILASIVLKPEEQVVLPTITPAPALIDASCAE